jgi:hypothetical protein
MLKYNIMIMFFSESELATISAFKPQSMILETSMKLRIQNTVS